MRLDNLPVAEMINFAFEDKPDKTMQIYNLGYALGGKLAVCICVCARARVCTRVCVCARGCTCVCVSVCVYPCPPPATCSPHLRRFRDLEVHTAEVHTAHYLPHQTPKPSSTVSCTAADEQRACFLSLFIVSPRIPSVSLPFPPPSLPLPWDMPLCLYRTPSLIVLPLSTLILASFRSASPACHCVRVCSTPPPAFPLARARAPPMPPPHPPTPYLGLVHTSLCCTPSAWNMVTCGCVLLLHDMSAGMQANERKVRVLLCVSD